MQNKTKLFLVVAVVFMGGFLVVNSVRAGYCVCGGSNNGSFATAPTDLCSTGEPGVDSPWISSSSGNWAWTCMDYSGNNSCTIMSCGATKTTATATACVCGSSDRGSFTTAPSSNLCQTGTPSYVTGTGPWSWSCGETCGAKSCSANKSTALENCVCGSSDRQSLSSAPTSNLCQTGTASYVTGTGPWTWSCGEVCNTVNCSASKSGSSSGDSCTSGTCLLGSACMNLGKGTCANSKNVCCLDDGSGNSGTTTPGAGITFPPNTGLPTNEKLVKGIFENVANFLLSIIGIIAIISFVISGIQYFLVATDEKMMETAKKTMVASIIGLVVALFGYIAVKTVEMLLKS